jgi:hypothetical protein
MYLPYPFLYSLAPDASGTGGISMADGQVGRLVAAASRSGRWVARRTPARAVLRSVAGLAFK